MFTEFGTFKDRPQMWFTRAWDATQDGALITIKTELGTEIEKAAARLAKKAASYDAAALRDRLLADATITGLVGTRVDWDVRHTIP
jgi:hypothetical protein